MNKQKQPYHPPRWPDKLLERCCAPHLLEEVMGDLHERFCLRAQKEGVANARRKYWREVLAYMRPSIFKRQLSYTKPLLFDMIRNHFTIALRNLTKHFSYTAINVVGLSVGLTASLFLALFIAHELSYDRFYTKADRIYRVETQKIGPEGTSSYAGTPLGVAAALRNDFSEIEEVATIVFNENQLVSLPEGKIDQARFKEPVAFTDHDIFSVFDYQWVAGNPQTALTEPNTVLLTESHAHKFFGYSSDADLSDVLGKVIQLNHDLDLKVVGILRDYPVNTSFPFDIIASLSTLKDLDLDSWGGWSDNNQTYVVLEEGSIPQQIENQFPQMLEKYKGERASKERGHHLLPLKEVHFGYNYSGRQGNRNTLYALGLIGSFLLIIACINFINFATTQATIRAKEVGVRKVLGSSRSQLVRQFMSETVLVTFLAFLLALGGVILLLPYTSLLMGITLSASTLINPNFIFLGAAIFVLVSFLSGLYPSWVLSGFRPVMALKNKIINRQKSGFTLRQGMVTLQFAISQVLLIGTLVVGSQMHMFLNADLGFNREAIITVELPDNQPEKLQTLRNQWLQHSEINDVSFSFNSASAESNFMGELLYKTDNGEISIRTQFKLADAHFLAVYGLHLLAGEALQERDTTDKILVNEVFTRKMGLQYPEEAVGKYVDNHRYTIAGVMQDFHVNSLHQNIDPTIILVSPQHYHQANIKMQTTGSKMAGMQSALQHIQEEWQAAFPDQLFSYQFLDETLAQAYNNENRAMQLLNVFAGIAIFISCLGLYGLVSFIAVQRTKEVGIRKVLGASVGQIIQLFSKEFVGLVVLAFAVAVPAGYYLMNQWLQHFAYRIAISWWTFALAGVLTLCIALLTVSAQALKAAVANPVDSLRNE